MRVFKGKHAEICKLISEGKIEHALQRLYAFFRSEDNTDSYSIELLTILRELLEDGDSDALGRMRIRMRSSGDKVMINLAQFMAALHDGGKTAEAELLSERCLSEMPRFVRSIRAYVDEEGMSQTCVMAGMRIHEALRIWMSILPKTDESRETLIISSLEVTELLLSDKPNLVSLDKVEVAKVAENKGDKEKQLSLCRELVHAYGEIVDRVAASEEFNREDYETVDSLKYAYQVLNDADSNDLYAEKLAKIGQILDEK